MRRGPPSACRAFSYGLGEQMSGMNRLGAQSRASNHTTIGDRVRRFAATLLAGGLVATGLATAVPTAQADTAPASGTPATVSADALPTWQINGVVWSQVLVGNTVYATGSFTKARPPGVAAGGAGEVDAQNIFAYDITHRKSGDVFNHSLNAQGLAITASPDGSRIYVGGDFTAVDGVARGHVAAFITATGALDADFAPSVSNQVRALAAIGNHPLHRWRLRSRQREHPHQPRRGQASTGALQPWAPGRRTAPCGRWCWLRTAAASSSAARSRR